MLYPAMLLYFGFALLSGSACVNAEIFSEGVCVTDYSSSSSITIQTSNDNFLDSSSCLQTCNDICRDENSFFLDITTVGILCWCSPNEISDFTTTDQVNAGALQQCIPCDTDSVWTSDYDLGLCGMTCFETLYGYAVDKTLSASCSTESEVETCFSLDATAVVYGKGKVKMSNLAVGDSVLVGPGIYDSVYSIDHRSTSALVDFIVLQTENSKEKALEITARHMLYVSGKQNPVPAGSITTNDFIITVNGPAKVLNISTVTRKGLINPLTSTGRIVVDGIVASTYSSFSENESDIEIFSYKLYSVHDLIHLAAVPYSWFCKSSPRSLELCNEHNGLAWTSKFFLKFSTFVFGQCAIVRLVIIIAYVAFFGTMNFVVYHPEIFIAIVVLYIAHVFTSAGGKIKSE